MLDFKYDKLESIKAKKKINKIQIIRNVYKNHFAPSNVIGQCITLCEKLKPTSCEDFEIKYHEYAQNNINLPIKERGLTKEELIAKINEKELPEDAKIELMEDITDSFGESEDMVTKEEFESITNKYEELLAKYKERFLDSKEEVKEDEDKEYEEKEVIDVKEI
jgi:hypothetical protein